MSQLADRLRERVVEVAVAAVAEAVAGHVDRRAEAVVLVEDRDEAAAGVGVEQATGDGTTDVVQAGRHRIPVERIDVAHDASNVSRIRLASTPPRYWPIVPSLR